MTNITPQQMRELAAEHEAQFKQFDDCLSSTVSTGRTRRTIEALHAAADQLEAVSWCGNVEEGNLTRSERVVLRFSQDITDVNPLLFSELAAQLRESDLAADRTKDLRTDTADGIAWMKRAKRLQAVIDDAPHDNQCHLLFDPNLLCTCWKAGVL